MCGGCFGRPLTAGDCVDVDRCCWSMLIEVGRCWPMPKYFDRQFEAELTTVCVLAVVGRCLLRGIADADHCCSAGLTDVITGPVSVVLWAFDCSGAPMWWEKKKSASHGATQERNHIGAAWGVKRVWQWQSYRACETRTGIWYAQENCEHESKRARE